MSHHNLLGLLKILGHIIRDSESAQLASDFQTKITESLLSGIITRLVSQGILLSGDTSWSMKNRVRMTEALVETVECVCSVTRRWRSKQIQQTIVSALVLVKLDLRLMLTPVKGFFLHTSRSAYGGMRWDSWGWSVGAPPHLHCGAPQSIQYPQTAGRTRR